MRCMQRDDGKLHAARRRKVAAAGRGFDSELPPEHGKRRASNSKKKLAVFISWLCGLCPLSLHQFVCDALVLGAVAAAEGFFSRPAMPVPLAGARCTRSGHVLAIFALGQSSCELKGPPKKKKKKTRGKKTIPKNNRPTFLFFFFFFRCPLRRLWAVCGYSIFHRMWALGTRSWLWGLPLRARVPSDGPFMWCLYKTFFLRTFFLFFPTDIFFSSEQELSS
jgi:hypothetical protein